MLNPLETQAFVQAAWADDILSTLVEYIRIPNKSPLFDPEWSAHGHMDAAAALIADWCRAHAPAGMKLEVARLPGRTPLIFMEIPATEGYENGDAVLLYGHLDKQPEMTGWDADLGPWKPVIRGDKLYGRGGADDGYAAFASLTAINALQAQGVPHRRCVVLIEGSEESGSPDLPAYIDVLADRIGTPSLVICLDSSCASYDQLWLTTSLRGVLVGDLHVELLTEGVHSGDASGVAADTFRIARQLIDRIEDATTGRVTLEAFHADIPEGRIAQAKAAGDALGAEIAGKVPLIAGAHAMSEDPAELILNGTWRPTLTITGALGLPELPGAGNVLRPYTELRLSLRLAPTADPEVARAEIAEVLLKDPPYGARVTFDGHGQGGWNAPPLTPWLDRALDAASRAHFSRPVMYMGEGGSIPFIGMLGRRFPAAQFFITGLLGPKSNAHGPNEFLHIPMARRLTACVSDVLADHARA